MSAPGAMMKFTPRNCQRLMRDFALKHHRCNLWATPGTGKTGACLELFALLKLLGSSFFPVLVLAPKRVAIDVWPAEVKKWDEFRDLRIVCLAGLSAANRVQALKRPADIYVINYDLVPWLCDAATPWPFKAVVADESTKLRGFRLRNGGKRAQALARVSKHVGRWINLTGTPRPKSAIDLWGQTWFLDRGERLERTFGGFTRRYFEENVYAHSFEPRAGAPEEIAEKIKDITLTIKAADYFDLPSITVTDHRVHLCDSAMSVYWRMEREMYAELAGTPVEAPNAAVKTIKCMQVASGAIYTDDKGSYEVLDNTKLEALEDIVEEADGPVLVAYHWKFDLERLKARLPSARVINTSKSIQDWNAGKIEVGLIHPGSAGHGIDLALGGNIVVFYSQWWDLELYMQTIERLGPTRQAQHGLNRPVFVHHLIAANTLDERCVARREARRLSQDATMEEMKCRT